MPIRSILVQLCQTLFSAGFVFAFTSLLSPFAVSAAENEDASPPNIVLIVSDDQAWTDYGFMGHSDIETPHLDRLAGSSLVFERGYVSSPLCRPSLASMVTGLYPFQHGITGNDVDGRNQRAELDVPLRDAFHQIPSFIRTLTSNGYMAHQSGKWWEGSWKDGGFTHGMTHGDPKRGGRHGDAGLAIGRQGMGPVTDFIDVAVDEKKPFLVWYAPFLPHTPHNPPERLLKKYSKPGRADDVAKYYAMCDWFDETCGELLGYLDKKGVTDNTIVIYICDNGWVARSVNQDDPDQKQWRGFSLRSKGSPFENGIRTPIMVSWPGRVKSERSPHLAHAIDLFPTIAAACGLKAPDGLPGINLLDAGAREQRDVVFGVTHSIHNMTQGNTDETLQYLWCVEREWKLLLRHAGKDTTVYRNVHSWDAVQVRLYNLLDDPQEQKNLAATHPEVVERLKKRIRSWHAVGAGSGGEQEDATVSTPSSPLEAALEKLDLPGVKINLEERSVDVSSSLCLEEGMLELIACTEKTKEHESIVSINAKSMHVHTALLLLGAKPGNPATRRPVTKDGSRFINIPPAGDPISVSLVFKDKSGKMVERPISDFIASTVEPLDQKFPSDSFLFAGSVVKGNGPGPKKYLSDITGNVISIATFGDELLCLPEVQSHQNGSLVWRIEAGDLPPVGTEVTLRLRPVKSKKPTPLNETK